MLFNEDLPDTGACIDPERLCTAQQADGSNIFETFGIDGCVEESVCLSTGTGGYECIDCNCEDGSTCHSNENYTNFSCSD